MADHRFYDVRGPFTLGDLAEQTGLELGPETNADYVIADVCALENLSDGQLSYAQGKHVKRLGDAPGGAAVVPPGTAAIGAVRQLLFSDAPELAFAQIANIFYGPLLGEDENGEGVHPNAQVSEDVVLEGGVRVGPGAMVEPGVQIGSGSQIGPGAVIRKGVRIGRNCIIGPNVTMSYTLMGDGVVVHAGTVLGSDGFGYVPGAGGHTKVPQLGRLVIQDRVEIGANTTIDRGKLGDTLIGEGTKIDNLVHIAHNCQIGRHCIIAAQVGFSGSTTVGDFTVFFGQVGVADHLKIGSRVVALAKSGLSKSVPDGQVVAGYPARPIERWHRESATLSLLTKARKNAKNPI